MVDPINALFEMCGGAFVFLNILKLNKDKKVRGVSIVAITFFTVWGFWNTGYYHVIGQTVSGLVAVPIALANSVWLIQMIYYNRKERHG